MFRRFARIRHEFGTTAFVQNLILLIGLAGMAVIGGIALATPWPAVVAVVGLLLGFLLRSVIPRGIEWYTWIMPLGGFAYVVVLLVGKQMGLSPENQLLIITATTVVVFNLQFWSLSDPSVVNTKRDAPE